MVSKRRMDVATMLERARALAEDVAAAAEPGRAELLTAGFGALWPAPLHAALLGTGDEARVLARDEAGHSRPEWADALRADLRRLAAEDAGGVSTAPPPPDVGLTEHALHGVAVARGGRRYGALALALHKRVSDVALAQTLLTYAADHLAFALFLRDQERDALARRRDLADFAALMAHDFNNALNGIGLQVAVLAHKGISPDDYPELAEVRREVRRAGARMREMQEFCQRGRPPLGAADLNRAARAAAAAHPAARLELAPDLPPVLGSDLDLERIAGVLLRNAAAAGAHDMLVRTGRGAGGAPWLRVEDDGAAPDDEAIASLFEPFAESRPGGEGEGLALVKAIVRRVEGSVAGEKRPGGGMTFTVGLRPARE